MEDLKDEKLSAAEQSESINFVKSSKEESFTFQSS